MHIDNGTLSLIHDWNVNICTECMYNICNIWHLFNYREHLYGLIDDKTFKTELTVFQIDKESELIQAEHRTELMPFVMR